MAPVGIGAIVLTQSGVKWLTRAARCYTDTCICADRIKLCTEVAVSGQARFEVTGEPDDFSPKRYAFCSENRANFAGKCRNRKAVRVPVHRARGGIN